MVLLILLLLLCCSWNDKVRCELEFNYDISSCNLYSRDYMRITHVNDKEEDQDDEEEEEQISTSWCAKNCISIFASYFF